MNKELTFMGLGSNKHVFKAKMSDLRLAEGAFDKASDIMLVEV